MNYHLTTSTSFGFLAVAVIFASCNNGLQDKDELTWNEHREPQYANFQDWAALPNQTDAADDVPKNLPSNVEIFDENELDVDVFFVHPTQYFEGRWWNSSLDDSKLNATTDSYPIRLQASAFQFGGKLYAPRYRQAHIGVFSWQDSTSYAAIELAYSDVKSAFEYYLTHWNQGRKIILAGHSQGSWHLRWLLQEFFDGKDLQSQLVAAYGPGFDWYDSDFEFIPPCKAPDEVGCVCSWMTYGGDYKPSWLGYKKEDPICTHPITWTESELCNNKSEHAGVVLSKMKFAHSGSLEACVDQGVLSLSEPDVPFGKQLQRENWHIGDINLFWLNIRENARIRSLSAQKESLTR